MGGAVTLFLAGDVMTGRGIDQILAHPGDPRLHEAWVHSAARYVQLAEEANGPVGRGLDPAYPWGDALAVLDAWNPAARIVNLETAVTACGDADPGKGIHYRMHPANVACLTAAALHCCVLANNHVLDWGHGGLHETLVTLGRAGLRWTGAGRSADEAAAPACVGLPGGRRLLVFAFAAPSSGVPASWAATLRGPGVNFLAAVDARTAAAVAATVLARRQPGDLAIVSIHWGGNWGFAIPREHRDFARVLVESGAADLVHGHSSHHPLGCELVCGKLVLHGCGDLINDYEGIAGHERHRPDLALMYLPELDADSGELVELAMVPLRRRRLRLEHAGPQDREWLAGALNRERGAAAVALRADGTLWFAPGGR